MGKKKDVAFAPHSESERDDDVEALLWRANSLMTDATNKLPVIRYISEPPYAVDSDDDGTLIMPPQPPRLAVGARQQQQQQERIPGAFRHGAGHDPTHSERVDYVDFALVGLERSNQNSSSGRHEHHQHVDTTEEQRGQPSSAQDSHLEERHLLPGFNNATLGLAVATQVEERNHDSLPQAEEEHHHTEEGENHFEPTRLKSVCCVLAILVAVTIMVSFLVGKSERPAEDLITGINSTPASQSTHSNNHNFTLDLLPADTQFKIVKPNTPQAKAYQWIMNDPYMTTYATERLVQRFALATLYFGTNGRNWFNSSKWLSYEHSECQWFSTNVVYNIGFDMEDYETQVGPALINVSEFPCQSNHQQRYSHLMLHNNNLQGQLPPEIHLLTSLKSISVDANHLQGSTIPSCIGKLTSLEVLTMAAAGISGTIPAELGLLTNLTYLILSSNSIHGTIPTELGLLSQNQGLLVDFNQLTGNLPSELGSLDTLGLLFLFYNFLTGSIPSQLGLAKSLLGFVADFNQLTGAIPSELGSSTSLSLSGITASNNLLSGTIPGELAQLTNLQKLYLPVNLLSGGISVTFGSTSSLHRVSLDRNQLTGNIPSELGLLTNLYVLSLGKNKMIGSIPTELDQSFSVLDFSANMFTGTVPAQLCDAGTDDFNCPYFSNFYDCVLTFDCSNMLCGCDCPCANLKMTNSSGTL